MDKKLAIIVNSLRETEESIFRDQAKAWIRVGEFQLRYKHLAQIIHGYDDKITTAILKATYENINSVAPEYLALVQKAMLTVYYGISRWDTKQLIKVFQQLENFTLLVSGKELSGTLITENQYAGIMMEKLQSLNYPDAIYKALFEHDPNLVYLKEHKINGNVTAINADDINAWFWCPVPNEVSTPPIL